MLLNCGHEWRVAYTPDLFPCCKPVESPDQRSGSQSAEILVVGTWSVPWPPGGNVAAVENSSGKVDNRIRLHDCKRSLES